MSEIGYYYTESSDIELVVAKGQAHKYPRHVHICHWTVGVVRRGTVFLTTEKNARRLHAGQYFCIRPYEPHSLDVEPESSLLTLCVKEKGAFFKDGDPLSLRLPAIIQRDEKALLAAVLALCKRNISAPEGYERCREEHAATLPRSIQEAMRLLMEKPDETLPIAQMAAYAGYSQWHFVRAFRKFTGITPHAFQLVCRMRLLRSMLRADTAGSTAAVSAGFADQSHMHKAFRRHHGVTPGEFKKASIKLEL